MMPLVSKLLSLSNTSSSRIARGVWISEPTDNSNRKDCLEMSKAKDALEGP